MSTHMPGFRSFKKFLHHFALTKLASGQLRVKGEPSVTDPDSTCQGDLKTQGCIVT